MHELDKWPKIIIFFLLIFCVPSIEGRRRKKIISRFEPVKLLTQNEELKKTEKNEKEGLEKKAEATEEEKLEEELEEEELEEELEGEEEELEEEEEETEGEEEEAEKKVDKQKKEVKKEKTVEVKEEPIVKDIFLNFEQADLKTFVNYIGELKKINLLVDPKIAGNKISLTIRDPLTIDDAWKVFLTILEMSNFSIVKAGHVYKIIPKQNKLTEALPVFIDTPSEKLPDSDLTIRYLTFLTNIPIEQVQPLLKSMLSDKSKIVPHKNSNGFVITDKSYNIKAAMKVVHELDRTDVKQSVTVMRLKHANADDVKKLFDSLMRKPEGHPLARLLGRAPEKSVEYFPPTTKIIAEQRTNSLILIGDQKSIKKIEDFIVNKVDTELKGIKSPIHIYELKYTDVDQIKDILENLVETDSESPAAKHGGIRGGVKYFKKMKFEMDEKNNRLLVSSTDEQDWKLLKKTIKELDKPQPQVALETLIVSVKLDKNKELGGQIRNKKHGQIGRNIDAQSANLTNVITKQEDAGRSLLGDLMQNMVAGLGSTILTFGKIGDVWSMIKMLQTQTNVAILSQPFIVTTNMKEAKIVVGEKRRVSYQRAIGDAVGNLGETFGYQDAEASLEVKVKPHINLDGVITLGINVDIVDFTSKDVTQPDTDEKHLQTKVSVADGQVLVLGGFIKTKVLEEAYKAPFFGNIPILGWLCKSKKRSITKEYIFIFMSPTIVKPRRLPGTNLYTKMKLYQSKEDIENAIEVRKIKDPVHNWFFNPEGETYSHKVVDYANARYQPTSVDIINDPYYRTKPLIEEKEEAKKEIVVEEKKEPEEIEPEEEEAEEVEEPEVEDEEEAEAEEEIVEEKKEPEEIEPEEEEEPEVEDEEEEAEEVEKPEVEDEEEETEEEKEEIVEKEKVVSKKDKDREIKRKQLREMLSVKQKPTKNLRQFLK